VCDRAAGHRGAALTLAPAVLAVGSRFGLLDPKGQLSTRGWRKVGTSVFVGRCRSSWSPAMIAIIGFVSLLTYVPQYNDEKYTPADCRPTSRWPPPSGNFSQARMNARAAHARSRPRPAQPGRHARHRPGSPRTSSISTASNGYRRSPDRLGAPIEHSSIRSNRHAKLGHPADRQGSERQHRANARAGRRVEQDHRQHGTHVCDHDGAHGHHPRPWSPSAQDGGHHQRVAQSHLRLRTISSGLFAPTSTGKNTASTFRVVGRFARSFDTLDGIDELADQLQVLTAVSIISTS